jgi:hypothetical protein
MTVAQLPGVPEIDVIDPVDDNGGWLENWSGIPFSQTYDRIVKSMKTKR